MKFHTSGRRCIEGSQSDQVKKLRSCGIVGSVSMPTQAGTETRPTAVGRLGASPPEAEHLKPFIL